MAVAKPRPEWRPPGSKNGRGLLPGLLDPGGLSFRQRLKQTGGLLQQLVTL
jgi:hypothetical protein